MRKCTLFNLLIFIILYAKGQNIPVETWRTHYSYHDIRLLETDGQRIFCAARNGFFYYDNDDNSINVANKVTGLSDVAISAMSYDPVSDQLIIGYQSGLVDLINESGVETIRDLYESSIAGNKGIHDIAVNGDRIFLATSIGIIVYSRSRGEVIESYRSIGTDGTDVEVRELFIFDNRLFAQTDLGVQSGDLQLNLLDFTNWTTYTDTVPASYSRFTQLDNQIYLIRNDTSVVALADTNWVGTGVSFDAPVISTRATGAAIYFLTENEISVWDGTSISTLTTLSSQLSPNDFILTSEPWIADSKSGLVRLQTGESILPDGPVRDQITAIKFIEDSLFAFYGAKPVQSPIGVDSLGYSTFNGNDWHYHVVPDFYNINTAGSWNGKLMLGSSRFGIYDLSINSRLDENSDVFADTSVTEGMAVSSLTSGDNELWMTAYNHSYPIWTYREPTGWSPYSPSVPITQPRASTISRGGLLWIQGDEGILALDPQDNSQRLINMEDGLPSNAVRSVLIDLDDEAWISTSNGIVSFPDATFIFDEFSAIEPIFENSELFSEEPVGQLAADGGDRLWVSTNQGLWVFDSRLSKLDHFFNLENSPLPSINILDMAYNHHNGEMFILTDKGLVSFRSGSSAGNLKHESVEIFPNPVRPGYAGVVGISGLVNNADVKITDVNGKLIRHLTANGGTASWDLLDYNHKQVAAGIYILFSSTSDGSETYVGKIAIVN